MPSMFRVPSHFTQLETCSFPRDIKTQPYSVLFWHWVGNFGACLDCRRVWGVMSVPRQYWRQRHSSTAPTATTRGSGKMKPWLERAINLWLHEFCLNKIITLPVHSTWLSTKQFHIAVTVFERLQTMAATSDLLSPLNPHTNPVS